MDYELSPSHSHTKALSTLDQFQKVSSHHFFLKVEEGDYQRVLKIQHEAQKRVLNHPKEIYGILCSHPPVFTLGRGVRPTKNDPFPLNPFLSSETSLPFPCHQIQRGGGLTFHYPGQVIFYVIRRLTPSYSLQTHVRWLLDTVRESLEKSLPHNHNLGLTCAKNPLGLWSTKDQKLQYKVASVGVGASHFITLHGIALNLRKHPSLNQMTGQVSPCGLSSDLYQSVEDLVGGPSTPSFDQVGQEIEDLFSKFI